MIPLEQLVIVALGSNLGDSPAHVRRAMERLQSVSAAPLLRSSLWQTTPVDCPPNSPLFVNAIIGLTPFSADTPEALLAKLQALERDFGRRPKEVLNEARPLDLDLIAFGRQTRASRDLVLPHPRAHLRRFVLEPLSEIAPEVILPRQTQTVRALLAALPADVNMRKMG